LNLLRIGRTHSGQCVAEHHAGFEQAEAIPELESGDGEIAPA
jgi:hypothetical protein